ncbi:MAG: HAD family hydrolase [Candidatus Nanosalina sp.]
MSYEAVIFDFDGVLMDSGFDGFQWALEERRRVIERKGWNMELDRLEQGIFQPDHSENIEEIMKQEDVSWKQLREMEKAVAERKVEMASSGEIKIFRDAENVLEELGCPMAVVSNAYRDYIGLLLGELGIKDQMDYWTAPSLEDIRNYRQKMKPEPDMIEETLQKLGTNNAVMVDDQFTDILAARKAGIDSVFIDRSGDIESKADYNITSLKELHDIVNS